MTLHLIKLCVGADSIADLAAWQSARSAERRSRGERDNPQHVTRMFPKKADLLVAGGSLYWVIKGVVLVRQALVACEPTVGEDGIARCRLVLDHRLIVTRPLPRRPFQGWRYFDGRDAPADIGPFGADDEQLPDHLLRDLSALGLA